MLKLLPIFTALILLLTQSCQYEEANSISALHEDKFDGNKTGLVDVGIFIDSRPTTTYGEIFSSEHPSSRWSGDIAINRDGDGYSGELHEAYSPGGLFYLKIKAMQKGILKAYPRKINILSGETVDLSNEEFRDIANTSMVDSENLEDQMQSYILPLPDDFSKIDDRQYYAIERNGSCQYLPGASDSVPVFPTQVQVKKLKKGGNAQKHEDYLDVPNEKYTLCRIPDEITNEGIEKKDADIFILPIKPSQSGIIQVHLYWDKKDRSKASAFNITVINLRKLSGRTNGRSIGNNVNIVPEMKNCEAPLSCRNGTIEAQVREKCREMNEEIEGHYAARHADSESAMRAQWNTYNLEYLTLMNQCNDSSEFKVYRRSNIHFSGKTVKLKIKNYHNLEILHDSNRYDYININLDFAKAVNAAFSGLNSNELKVSGLNVSSLCRKTKVSGTNRWSRHAYCSAMDISRVKHKDTGKWHTLLEYKKNSYSAATTVWLRKVRDHFCNYFSTVLGPEFNYAHRNHFHIALNPHKPAPYDSMHPLYTDVAAAPPGIDTAPLTLTSFLELEGIEEEIPPHDPIDYREVFKPIPVEDGIDAEVGFELTPGKRFASTCK